MTCLGVLDRGKRGDDNETSLKQGGVIEMSTTVLPLRDARSFALNTYHSCYISQFFSRQRRCLLDAISFAFRLIFHMQRR